MLPMSKVNSNDLLLRLFVNSSSYFHQLVLQSNARAAYKWCEEHREYLASIIPAQYYEPRNLCPAAVQFQLKRRLSALA